MKKRTSGTFIIVLLLFMLFFNSVLSAQISVIQRAERAVVDLTGWDFEQKGERELSGEWEFYWNKLYTPKDFKNLNLIPDTVVNVPSAWNNYTVNGTNIPSFGFATYRLQIKTAPVLKGISLYVPNQSTASELFFNGKLLVKSGNPSSNKETHVSSRQWEVVDLHLDTCLNELVVHVSNYDQARGGMWYVPSIGTHSQIRALSETLMFSDIFLAGILFLITIFSFSLFFFRRNDKASLYFALFSLSFFIRVLFTNSGFVEHSYPDFPYFIARKIEYLTLSAFTIFFLLFLVNLFPNEKLIRVNIILLIPFGVYAAIVLFLPLYTYSGILAYIQALILVVMVYCFYLIIKAVKQKHLSAKLILIGFIFIPLSAVTDILSSNFIINLQIQTAPIATVFFIILQLVALVFHILSVENDKANLESNLQTINQLNDIGLDVIANLQVESILTTVYDKLHKLINFDNLAFGIYNPSHNTLEFIGKSGGSGQIEKSEDSLDQQKSLSVISFLNDENIIISDYSTEYKKYFPNFVFYSDTLYFQSLIYIPLKAKDKKIGVLTIQNKEKDAFSDFDVQTIQNTALFASVAFDNANAYQTLNANEQKLSAILGTANEGIGLIDNQGRFTFVNQSLCSITGYSAGEMHELHYSNMLAPDDSKNRLNFADLISGKIKFLSAESQYIKKNGQKIWGKLSATCVRDTTGKARSIVSVITDIEEIKQNELRLKRANDNIISSINYAGKIQQALLPSDELFSRIFPDSFILFKPKEIVSGDFYFARQTEGETLLAVADCTGHGIPGAMMSMLGISLLNEIVIKPEITTPAVMLNALRDGIKQSLRQTGGRNEQQDGMDIAFIAYNKAERKINFAGAYSALFIFREEELIEIKGDKMPIGIYRKEKPFTNHEIEVKTGDVIYAFSDGYHSQLGGGRSEKFKTTRFKTLLTNIRKLSMDEQKRILDLTFGKWKGINDQTDDVLVVGLKISN